MKKRKLNQIDESSTNPLQRGKYGLRMLPQQVDYYQSVLEDRKIKQHRESSRQNSKDGEKDEKQTDETQNSVSNKKNVEHKHDFRIGEVVWATLPNYKTWFPALIISHLHCKQKSPKKGHIWVYWFGDHKFSEIPKSKIKPFFDYFKQLSKGTSSLTSVRMKEALQILATRANVTLPIEDIPATSTSNNEIYDKALISWAENGFPLTQENNSHNPFAPDPLSPIPSLVLYYLPFDSAYQEELKTDDRLQQIVYYDVDKVDNTDDSVGVPEYKQSQIERVRKGQINLNQICISCCCDAETRKGSNSNDLLEHPLFEGGLCRLCFDNIKVTMYAPGDDNKNSFCSICGQLGKLTMCENNLCHRAFCLVCIQLYVGPGTHLKVLETEGWECYLCKSNIETGLLKVRLNWRNNVKLLFDPLTMALKIPENIKSNYLKKPLRVLSLFDGAGEAKIALKNLGFQIDSYFACENDKDALSIAQLQHANSISYLNALEQIKIEKISEISPIDLLIGHFPSNELNLTNPNRKGFFDNKGPGYHFLYFNHILQMIRLVNHNHHVFFLFEFFSVLNDSQRDTISDILMCKPITINANNISNENRIRFVWSNIPGVNRPITPELQDNISVLTKLAANIDLKSIETDSVITEIEKSFGFNENYTAANDFSRGKRVAILKKVWCVPLLTHLFWSLSDFFHKEFKLV